MSGKRAWRFEIERGHLYDGTPVFFYRANRRGGDLYGVSGPVDTLDEARERLEWVKRQFDIAEGDIEWSGEYQPETHQQLELF